MSTRRAASTPFLIIVLLLFVFVLTAWTAWRGKCATTDEPLHFMGAWLQSHYDDFRCDPEDPPLWRYWVTLGSSKTQLRIPTSGLLWDGMLRDRLIQGLFFKDVFYFTPGNDPDAVISAARLKMLILGAFLGAAIAWWAWKLAGPLAAVVAAAAFCFDPNFLANSPLVKNDVPISLALLLFMASLWSIGRRATPLRWLAMSLAVGAALTVKFSGVLALPLMGAALSIRALLPEPWPVLRWTIRTRSRRLIAAVCLTLASCVIAYVFIWACYCFRYGPSTDPNQLFDFNELLRITAKHEAIDAHNALYFTNQQLQDWTLNWKPPMLFSLVLWIGNHHLLPQTWVEGFLFTYGTAPGRDAFLLGQSYMNGRWYYFPVAMAVKTPLTTLAAAAIAIAYWLRRRWSPARGWDIFSLLSLPMLYLAFAMSSHLNLGLRHVLPVYPFLFIVLGITAARANHHKPMIAKIVIALFLLGLSLETYEAYPDFIPFFNIAAGGWQNGPKLLGGANLDWGQDLPSLARWQRDHPQYQLFLDYCGSADPRFYRIHYVDLPGSNALDDQTPSPTMPAVCAISADAPHNPWLSQNDKDYYKKLQSEKPITVLGHCIYLYNPP